MQNEFIKKLNDMYIGKVIAMPKIDDNDSIASFTFGKIKNFYTKKGIERIFLDVEFLGIAKYENGSPKVETMIKTYEFSESSFDNFNQSSLWTFIFKDTEMLVNIAALCKYNYFQPEGRHFDIGKEDE